MTKKEKENIIIITHEFYPKKGGIANFIEGIAYGAYNNNYNVIIYAPYHEDINKKKYPFKIKFLYHKGKQDLLCRLKTALILFKDRKELKNNILYLPEPGPIRLFIYLQFILKKNFFSKIIITLHGSEILFLKKFFINKLLFQYFINKVNKVTLLSNYTKNIFCKYFKFNFDKIFTTPGALRIGFEPNNNIKNNLSKNKKFTLLTVARIHPRKGHDKVIKAISKIKNSLKNNIIYNIVGPTVNKSYKDSLIKLIQKEKINVNFLGEIDDENLPKVYREADLFILTSIEYKNSIEGFGLVFLEAFASGTPVVATNTGGVSDVVKDNVNGILLKKNTIEELTKVIEDIMIDNKKYNYLVSNCKKYAYKTSWEENAKITFN